MLADCRANIAEACRRTAISRSCYYTWMRDDPNFAEAVRHIQAALVDDIEDRLIRLAQKDRFDAIKLYLQAKAKDRGYVDRQEITGARGGPIQSLDARLNLNLPPPPEVTSVEEWVQLTREAAKSLQRPQEPETKELTQTAGDSP